MQEQDVIQLMLAAKAGDTASFGVLYKLYYTPVFRYLFVRSHNVEISEDLAQTVFAKVYASIQNFHDQGVSPLAYFFTVARHTLCDYWKKKKDIALDTPDLIAVAPPVSADTVTKMIEHKENSVLVAKALSHLNEEQKEALTLKYFGELPNSEIAAVLGKSEEAVRQIQCRALKALRQHIKAYVS